MANKEAPESLGLVVLDSLSAAGVRSAECTKLLAHLGPAISGMRCIINPMEMPSDWVALWLRHDETIPDGAIATVQSGKPLIRVHIAIEKLTTPEWATIAWPDAFILSDGAQWTGKDEVSAEAITHWLEQLQRGETEAVLRDSLTACWKEVETHPLGGGWKQAVYDLANRLARHRTQGPRECSVWITMDVQSERVAIDWAVEIANGSDIPVWLDTPRSTDSRTFDIGRSDAGLVDADCIIAFLAVSLTRPVENAANVITHLQGMMPVVGVIGGLSTEMIKDLPDVRLFEAGMGIPVNVQRVLEAVRTEVGRARRTPPPQGIINLLTAKLQRCIKARPEVLMLAEEEFSDDQLRRLARHAPQTPREYCAVVFSRSLRVFRDESYLELTIDISEDNGRDVMVRYPPGDVIESASELSTRIMATQGAGYILLGESGSGKTTVLRRIALEVAANSLATENYIMPWHVRLAEYAESEDTAAPQTTPHDWLDHQWSSRMGALREHSKQILFLLDGLNELPCSSAVSYEKSARQWREYLNGPNVEALSCGAVVTSRRTEYNNGLGTEDARFHRLLLRPLHPDVVRIEINQKLARSPGSEVSPQLLDLYSTPMFLSLLRSSWVLDAPRCVGESGRVPSTKVGLLAHYTKGLLQREAEKNRPEMRPLPPAAPDTLAIPPYPVVGWLGFLGFWMVQGNRSEVASDEFRPEGAMSGGVGEAMFHLATDIGLLIELHAREKDLNVRRRFRWRHDAFRDFFAGRHVLLTLPSEDCTFLDWSWQVGTLKPLLSDIFADPSGVSAVEIPQQNRWTEAMRMAVGMCSDENVEGMIRSISKRDLPVAAQCVREVQSAAKGALAHSVWRQLVRRVRDSRADIRARVVAGRAIGQMDGCLFWAPSLRGGVTTPIWPKLCEVPAGRYSVGNPTRTRMRFEHSQRYVDLDAYRIGRFPVTNLEYGRFLSCGGYSDGQYWQDIPPGARDDAWRVIKGRWERRHRYLQEHPELPTKLLQMDRCTVPQAVSMVQFAAFDDDAFAAWFEKLEKGDPDFSRPRFWENDVYSNPNLPVVGVSQYEAMAYCAWLSALSPSLKYFLPSEDEWEAAAGGPEGLCYPWGSVFDRERCNTYEGRLRCITPIGVFGNGRSWCGCSDMSGNVFEWTSTRFLAGGDEGSAGMHSEEVTCKGGGWNHHHERARTYYRGQGHPLTRNQDLGFRVCAK